MVQVVRYIFFIIVAFLLFTLIGDISALNNGSGISSNLTIWSPGTSGGYNLSYGTIWSKTVSYWNFDFIANYTNATSAVTNSSGDCMIRFNDTFSVYSNYTNMTYNSSSLMWEHNRSFNYRGNISYEVWCNSSYGNVSVLDVFLVKSTAPWINKTEHDKRMSVVSCTEDNLTSCTYNLSTIPYVFEDDYNDKNSLIFQVVTSNTTLTNYTLYSYGLLVVNKTNMNASIDQEIMFTVIDSSSLPDTGTLPVSVTALNDAPYFPDLTNKSFNRSILFEYVLTAYEEEGDYPLYLNITHINCTTAEWSYRNSTDCVLINESRYSFDSNTGVLNISFTPSRDDVGNYTINISVKDTNNYLTPYNASFSKVVLFEVLNVNEAPNLTYVCDNERNATEDVNFQCYINASDIDEVNSLTFNANKTWFLFNNSGSSSVSLNVNITTNYSASAWVNFTPSDNAVGNWLLNISVSDNGSPVKMDSIVFSFNVSNVNDSVYLDSIDNVSMFSTDVYNIYVNASDGDLLVDESVYTEVLNFSSNLSWISTSAITFSDENYTTCRITIDPNSTLSNKNHTVNISVRDNNNFSISFREFRIEVIGNEYPVWNETTLTNYTFNEDSSFYLNLSANVSDPDGQQITFYYINYTSFESYNLDTNTGVIDFSPNDFDVGYHRITIIASDGYANSSLDFNFTVVNINDAVGKPFLANLDNGTLDSNYNVNVSEGRHVTLRLYIEDDDFKIPGNQKDYYNENLTLSLTIEGVNSSLFNFSYESILLSNRSMYSASFTPRKNDVGLYNITVSATDESGSSSSLVFNLTVIETSDPPVLDPVNESFISSIVETFYLDLNASDDEDGGEDSMNLTYNIVNLSQGNFLTINGSTGIINVSMDASYAGFWEFNVSVSDSDGNTDSSVFNLTVYDYPVIYYPLPSYIYYMAENASYQLDFKVNDTIGLMFNNTVSYDLIIGGNSRNQTNGYGNGTLFSVFLTTNFSDETTCGRYANITLNVSNPKLSNSTSWTLNVNHTNSPLVFESEIGDPPEYIINGTASVTLYLSNYFIDDDAGDVCHNQSVEFKYNHIGGDDLSVSLTNWTNAVSPSIVFSSSASAWGNYSIDANEYYNSSFNSSVINNDTSNNFSISISIVTQPEPQPVSSSGGGGSSSGGSKPEPEEVPEEKPELLKLLLPDSVEIGEENNVTIIFQVINEGQKVLKDINLFAEVYREGNISENSTFYFDKSYFNELMPRQIENVSLFLTLEDEEGLYEIIINGTVNDPEFSDWGKIILTNSDKKRVASKILFVDELIASNPQCSEIREILNEARDYYNEGEYLLSEGKLNEAINACKLAISQKPNPKLRGLIKRGIESGLFTYLAISCVLAILIGMAYYWRKRSLYRRELRGKRRKI